MPFLACSYSNEAVIEHTEASTQLLYLQDESIWLRQNGFICLKTVQNSPKKDGRSGWDCSVS